MCDILLDKKVNHLQLQPCLTLFFNKSIEGTTNGGLEEEKQQEANTQPRTMVNVANNTRSVEQILYYMPDQCWSALAYHKVWLTTADATCDHDPEVETQNVWSSFC